MKTVFSLLLCSLLMNSAVSAQTTTLECRDIVVQQLTTVQTQLGQLQAQIEQLRKQDYADHTQILGDTHSLADTAKRASVFFGKYIAPALVAYLAGVKSK